LSIETSKRLLIIILWIFTLGGCQIQELNHSAVVAGLGINWEEEQLRVSMQMARPALAGQSSDSGPVFDIVSAQGRSLSEGLRKINLLFPRNPLVSQARLLVIGEQLAEKDLALITDACLRSPDIRKNLSVVVAGELVSPKPPSFLLLSSTAAIPPGLQFFYTPLDVPVSLWYH
jgi:spore germination protein KC